MFNTNPWLAYSLSSNCIKSSYIQGFLDVSGNIILRNGGFSLLNGNVSMNGNLYVELDASFNRNVFINGVSTINGDASMNRNLYVGLDASFNRNVFIKGITTITNGIYQIDGSYNVNIASAVGTFPNYGTSQNGNRLINIGSGNFNLTSTGLNDCIAIGNTIISASNPTGYGHIGIGEHIFQSLTSGFQNIGIGNVIATSMTIGRNNVFIGNSVATSTSSTENTVAIGTAAGRTNTTGINNTYLGAFTNANLGTYNNSTAIGYGATITASNQIKIGTSTERVDISGNLNVSQNLTCNGMFNLLPVGMVMQYTGTSAPIGWLLCQGGTLNADTNAGGNAIYEPLWLVIGIQFGGTGKSSFKLPDYRGAFLRGAGTNAVTGYTAYAGQIINTPATHATQTHVHNVNHGHGYGHMFKVTGLGQAGVGFDVIHSFPTGRPFTSGGLSVDAAYFNSGDNNGTTNATETRPFNFTVNYLIKY